LEEGREVKTLVAPVEQIARAGPSRRVPHDIEDEAIVCADADGVGGGHGCETERAPEVEDDGLAQRGGGVGDPGGVPGAGGRIGSGWAAAVCDWARLCDEIDPRARAGQKISAHEDGNVSIHGYRPILRTDKLTRTGNCGESVGP